MLQKQRKVRGWVLSSELPCVDPITLGNLTGNGVELGLRDGIWNASNHLEPVEHGDEEDAVEASFVELHHGVDILKRPTNRLCRKSTKIVVVELMLALCEAKVVIDARNCRVRAIRSGVQRV